MAEPAVVERKMMRKPISVSMGNTCELWIKTVSISDVGLAEI
jgi:hypothetical protein